MTLMHMAGVAKTSILYFCSILPYATAKNEMCIGENLNLSENQNKNFLFRSLFFSFLFFFFLFLPWVRISTQQQEVINLLRIHPLMEDHRLYTLRIYVCVWEGLKTDQKKVVNSEV